LRHDSAVPTTSTYRMRYAECNLLLISAWNPDNQRLSTVSRYGLLCATMRPSSWRWAQRTKPRRTAIRRGFCASHHLRQWSCITADFRPPCPPLHRSFYTSASGVRLTTCRRRRRPVLRIRSD